jgi:hypothetical protein
MNTQEQLSPPNNGDGNVVTCAGFPEELGDQIANLTISEAQELTEYLKIRRDKS